MACLDKFLLEGTDFILFGKRILSVALLLVTAVGVTACGNKEEKVEQALAKVNGVEITSLQVNDELRRANIGADRLDVASKQMLESLIDRQLILAEAMRNEIDRAAGVAQAIERAKAQIIAQAYLKRLDAKIPPPSQEEINEYYQSHPEYFSRRKQYDIEQVVISAEDFTKELRLVVDSAKSLETAIKWMDIHNVHYVRGQLSRTTTDLPEPMVLKLKDIQKGQLFILNEGEICMISRMVNVKARPIDAKAAIPQIEQYLKNKKVNEMAQSEITRLRASAKIEYLHGKSTEDPK